MQIYLNSNYIEKDEATLSIDDRGFLFGDGAYEVIRVYRGRMFEGPAHMRRLDRSLAELRIGYENCSELIGVAEKLVEINGLHESDATVYFQITRGAARRSHCFPPADTTPTVYIAVNPFNPDTSVQESGGSVRTAADIRWARCDIKSVNLLPNVLENQNCKEQGITETVFVRDGMVTEGTHSNIFAFCDGNLFTYPKCNYILGGVTRDRVISLASGNGFNVVEEPMTLDKLYRVEEVFLSGTTVEVLPVVEIDGNRIGDGRPGARTRRLQQLFREMVEQAVA